MADEKGPINIDPLVFVSIAHLVANIYAEN